MAITLDVFNTDEFSDATLSKVLDALPAKPTLLEDIGFTFEDVSVNSGAVSVIRNNGIIQMVSATRRGTNVDYFDKFNNAHTFGVPSINTLSVLRADELISYNKAMDEEESFATAIAKRIQSMRDNSITPSYNKLQFSALSGVLKDPATNEVIENYYNAFGVSVPTALPLETPEDFDAATDAVDTATTSAYEKIIAFLGSNTYSALLNSIAPNTNAVPATFVPLYSNRGLAGFEFRGITVYRVPSTLLGSNTGGFIIPTGIAGQFVNYIAPNDDVASVGAMGQKYYVNTQQMPFDKGVNILVTTNQLPVNVLPELVIPIEV